MWGGEGTGHPGCPVRRHGKKQETNHAASTKDGVWCGKEKIRHRRGTRRDENTETKNFKASTTVCGEQKARHGR